MKKKIIILTVLFIVLQLAKMLLLWEYKTCYSTSKMEILINGETILSDDVSANTEMKEVYQIAEGTCEKNLLVENNDADVIGVNVYWQQVQKPQMLAGNFWGEEADKEGRSLAVISDTLAVKLWGSEKAVGNLIHINDQVYQVSGVYKRYKKIWQYCLDDGKEKVYIPLKSQVCCKWPIQFMVIDGNEQKVLPEESELYQLGIDSSRDVISHQENWFKCQRSLAALPVFLISFLIVLFTVRKIVKAVRDNKKSWKKKLFIMSGSILLTLVLLRGSMLGLYIDPTRLPSENIFDVVFYWEALLKEWSRHNQMIRYPASQFEGAYYLIKHWNYFINFLQLLIGVRGIRLFRKIDYSCYHL